MTSKRMIEVFSAGCPCCEATVERVRQLACPSCEVAVLDMAVPKTAERARELGVHAVPAVAIDGKLADCCLGRGPSEDVLSAAGLGRPSA